MVKTITQTLFIFCLVLSLTQAAFAASFTATVDRTNVTAGESLTLQLGLSGASPKGTPDFSPLNKDFTVHSTGKSSQTTIVNGKMSSSMNWQTILIPKKQGAITIPALTIDSDAGTLKSQPVKINVAKPGTLAQNTQGRTAVFVDTQVSKTEPYKNEPVLLTAKLIARKSISDVALPDLSIPDAVIERQGEPQVYDAALQGQNVKVVEAHYLVTPLQDGVIKIPGVTFQGNVESGKRQDPFAGHMGGRFGDPFGMFEDFGAFPGFSSFKPFAISGQDITLNVKPPAAPMNPWLPASALKLSDQWEGLEGAKVGEPLTRKVTITADSLSATALPSLENQIDPQGAFKIYADKPVTEEKMSANGQSINSIRVESYTLIPQKSGAVTLPEMKLDWWDVNSNTIATASVPAKTINVKQAAVQPQAIQTPKLLSVESPTPKNVIEHNSLAPIIPKHLYIIIAVLGGVVVVMAGFIFYLFRKLSKQGANIVPPKTPQAPANEDKITLSALKTAKTPNDLKLFLQFYAHQHWGLPKNAALQIIAAAIQTRNAQADVTIFTTLDTALYAGGAIDVEDAKKQCLRLLKRPQEKAVRKQRKLGALNPS